MRNLLRTCLSMIETADWLGTRRVGRNKKRRLKKRMAMHRLSNFEPLESRRVFAVAPPSELFFPQAPSAPSVLSSALSSYNATLLVPTGDTPVHFFWDSSDTTSNNEVGYFFVGGPDGRITKRVGDDPDGAPILDGQGAPQYVRPGDSDYAKYALAVDNSVAVFASGEVPNHGQADKTLDVNGDHYISFYVVQNDTSDHWRQAVPSLQPNVWFSLTGANRDRFEHFRSTSPFDPHYHPNVIQYKVEDAFLVTPSLFGSPLAQADFNDVLFSVNIVPFASQDDYTVMNAGTTFQGAPQPVRIDTPSNPVNAGLGLLFNDRSFNGRPLRVTDVQLDLPNAPWVPVNDPFTHMAKVTITDPSLHGTLTLFGNGGFEFFPKVSDPYWHPLPADPEPDQIYLLYRVSDGVDLYEQYISFSHGFYRAGAAPDNLHQGKKMYLLAGGGDSDPFEAARIRFFSEGSNLKDIVLISQGSENKDFTEQVYDVYAGGLARSVTSLSITTRDQANDPRIVSIVDGADALWFGGGAQSYYQSIWQGTALFNSLARAALANVAIGGTSAGMAVLGQLSYVDFPWDSVQSSFATQRPLDTRINLVAQGPGGLPFGGIANSPTAPLFNIITDTHFADRDRMGRLVTFAAARRPSAPLNGLGVDDETALLIEPSGVNWLWSVYGSGHVYLVTPTGPAQFQDNQRLTYGPINVFRLDPTGAAGAQTITAIKQGAPTYHIQVKTGTIFTTENGGSLY